MKLIHLRRIIDLIVKGCKFIREQLAHLNSVASENCQPLFVVYALTFDNVIQDVHKLCCLRFDRVIESNNLLKRYEGASAN